MNDVMNLLQSHRSIRKYTDKPVSVELVKEIIQCAQCASTSNFIQAYTVIHVTDAEKKKEISAVAGGQQWVIDCPLFLVFLRRPEPRKGRPCEMQGKPFFGDSAENFLLVATVDAALLAQNTNDRG